MGPSTRPVPLPDLGLFAVLAAALFAVRMLVPVPGHVAVLLPLLALGGLAWWWAVVRADAGRGASFGMIVVGACVLRALVFGADLQLSDDVHRYVWEGALVTAAVSPYAHAPEDPALARFRTELPETYARMNNRDVSAAYPPGAQAAFAAAFMAGGRSEGRARLALRLLFTACDLALLFPLRRLLTAHGRPPALVLAWAWSPIVVLAFAGTGHFDALGILLWVAGLALWVGSSEPARRRTLATVLFVAAALTKLLPACALPFALRGPGWQRRAAAGAGLVAIACLPLTWFEGGASGLFSGLSEYGRRWEAQSLLFRLFGGGLPARVAVVAAWLGAAAWLFVRRAPLVRACGLLTGLFLVLSPTLHPWYVTWIVPFVALRPRPAWCWLVAAAPLLYWPVGAWRARGEWVEPAFLWPLVALPFFVLLARELLLARPVDSAQGRV